MKCICPMSGVVWEVSNFSNLRISAIHPMLYQPLPVLFKKLEDWVAQKLTEDECRVLFVSLLNSTGAVLRFDCAAEPKHTTVQKNMEALAGIVQYMTAVTSGKVTFPSVVINSQNADLSNIRVWIDMWMETKKKLQQLPAMRAKFQKLELLEINLKRLINSPHRNPESYAGILADWALSAATPSRYGKDKPIDNETAEYYRSLFKLKGVDIYNARRIDLVELVEDMEDGLERYAGTDFSYAVLKFVRDLLKKNTDGWLVELGGNIDYRLLEDDVEIANRKAAAAEAPEFLPQPSQYTHRFQYLRAVAAYTLAQAAKKQRAEFEEQIEANLEKDALDNIDIGEDNASYDTEDDIENLRDTWNKSNTGE